MLAKESAASSLQVSGTKIKGFHFLPNAFIQSWGEFDLPAEIRMSPAKASKHSGTTWNNLFVDVCCIIVKQTICILISALGFCCAKIIKRWRSARTTSRHHQCIRHLSRRIGSKTCKTKVLSVETMHGSGEKLTGCWSFTPLFPKLFWQSYQAGMATWCYLHELNADLMGDPFVNEGRNSCMHMCRDVQSVQVYG